MNSTLCDLPDDVLIYTIKFLSIPDILILCQILSIALPISKMLARRLSSDPEETTQMAANRIKKNPVSVDNMGYLAWAQVLRVVAKRRDIHGVKLNVDPKLEVGMAVSLSQRIVLLHLDDNGSLHEIHSFDTDLCPVSLAGNIIALDGDASKMLIYNLKTDEHAYLDDIDDPQHDHCLQVIFTPLMCSAPAVWIRPRDPAMVSSWEEHDGCEALIAAVFPGPLNPTPKLHICEVCMNTLNDWTAFDYDKDLGRIAVGSGFGKIMIV
ncbi:uncharacterized protein ARMOST_20886 [Armillaria ostoyae]|uniref:F-box domain-containing protein n=1 Tax=Armillaria ostoyae TaxID=47428 RepID=A0A284S8P3_ARMOS|nr:uncharacterized protein ARMOST_20886 [Armillaria ostoyae]